MLSLCPVSTAQVSPLRSGLYAYTLNIPMRTMQFYVKGLSEFNQSGRLFDGLFDLDNSTRDIGTARESFVTLGQLIEKYPNSPYAPDARQRLISLRNQLARSEINVANYYFSRGALVAAANRGQFVVENFQQSPAVADGLAVMALSLIHISEPTRPY